MSKVKKQQQQLSTLPKSFTIPLIRRLYPQSIFERFAQKVDKMANDLFIGDESDDLEDCLPPPKKSLGYEIKEDM